MKKSGFKMKGFSGFGNSPITNKSEKKHFLERDKVGPIATQKPFDPESYFEDKDLEDRLHTKHAIKNEGTIEEQEKMKKKK